MQFDKLRAFPYPVLRPGSNDYLDSAIQTIVDFVQSDDHQTITVEVDLAVGVEEIQDIVMAGKASYAAVIACRDTYYRKAILASEPQLRASFSSGELRGEVLVYPYVVATEAIDDFSCSWINPEFGDGPFAFPNGAVLAVDEPQMIYLDRETFRPISSCFTLVSHDQVPPYEWQIDTSGDKVQIAVSPMLKTRIGNARNTKENKAILINSIYFAAVVQCLALLKANDEIGDQRWARIFQHRLSELHLELDKHPETWLAQQLMRHPFAIVDRYFFGESGE